MGETSEIEAAPAAALPLKVEVVASNLPFVLRTLVGMAALAIGANVTGVIVVFLVIAAMNARATQHQGSVLLTTTGVMLGVSLVLGVTAATAVQRRTLRWLLRGERPTRDDARRALRMPLDMASIAAVLWLLGGVVLGVVSAASEVDAQTVLGIVGGIVLAGLSSAGVTYLLVGRVSQPVARLALEAWPPSVAPIVGVRWRLLLIWVLTTGVPVLGLVFVLAAPRGKTHVVGTGIVVGVVAIVVGGLSTLLAARSIGEPLRGVVDALRRIGAGELDLRVPVADAGEIGLVQNGINDMVTGLRERDHVKDLFGRHVGPSVAHEALEHGVTLSGELRDVVALFVDITGSTQMSRDRDPADFVATLNRFFEVVVDEVERNGGLLNKFEGDAALCVFGAPVELTDPAAAALRAARRIRDRVFAMGEVDVGVGVAAGPVVAGQIGTANRLEFTVIGDAVNEAARLTDLAKDSHTHVLASAPVLERADGRESEHWERAGEVTLRGRDVPTTLWRPVG